MTLTTAPVHETEAKHVFTHLNDTKPDGVENEAVEQIAFADRIVLNKTDLAGPDEVTEVSRRIRAINAGAAILPAVRCKVDLNDILRVQAFNLDAILATEPEFPQPCRRAPARPVVTSVGIEVDGALDPEALNTWLLASRRQDLFHSKGMLTVAGVQRRYLFQGVHMLHERLFGEPWRPGERGATGWCSSAEASTEPNSKPAATPDSPPHRHRASRRHPMTGLPRPPHHTPPRHSSGRVLSDPMAPGAQRAGGEAQSLLDGIGAVGSEGTVLVTGLDGDERFGAVFDTAVAWLRRRTVSLRWPSAPDPQRTVKQLYCRRA